jgi:hypothetical protein
MDHVIFMGTRGVNCEKYAIDVQETNGGMGESSGTYDGSNTGGSRISWKEISPAPSTPLLMRSILDCGTRHAVPLLLERKRMT